MLVLLGFVFYMILRRNTRENSLYITSIYTFYVGTIENHVLYQEFSPNHSTTYYIEFQCRFMTKITQPIYVSFDYVIYHTHKIKLASANWTGLNPIMDIQVIINAVLDFLLRIHSEILNRLEAYSGFETPNIHLFILRVLSYYWNNDLPTFCAELNSKHPIYKREAKLFIAWFYFVIFRAI